jgi:hypothetical protein
MDDMLLMLVHPAGQGNDEKGKRIQQRAHGCRFTTHTFLMTFNRFAFLHGTGDHKLSLVCPRKLNQDGPSAPGSGRWWRAQNPADHILINSGSESQIDLTGNLGASPGWIALFHLDNSANQISRWTFGTLSLANSWNHEAIGV